MNPKLWRVQVSPTPYVGCCPPPDFVLGWYRWLLFAWLAAWWHVQWHPWAAARVEKSSPGELCEALPRLY